MSRDLQEMLADALPLHQSGRFEEAERSYREVLALDPRQCDALNLLGVLCLQTGRVNEAEQLLERAVKSNPSQALFHLHLGNARDAAGKHAQAIECWRRAINLQSDLVDAHLQLAGALLRAGEAAAAERQWRQILRLAPNLPEAHFQLGQLLASQKRFPEAVDAFVACLRLDPTRFVAHNALGCALSELKQHEAAAEAFARAVELSPRTAPFYMNLGQALRAAGRVPDAEAAFRSAIELCESVLGTSYHGLAASLRDLERLEDAAAAARKAIEHAPTFAPGYHNLGNIQYDLGKLDEAVASYRKSLELDPSVGITRTGLLLLLHYRHGNEPQLLFDEHLNWAALHADPLTAGAAPHRNSRDPDRQLRVGYVSADFRDHPVAYFLESLLAAHDRARVHLQLYSSVTREDEFTERFRAIADVWHDVRALSDEQLAAKIREDQIDILVDLSGHIAHNRLLAFAHKPAPVQVTYLGYPDTTGMRAMDYRLTDAWHDPPGLTDAFHTEKLVRLPGGAWCYRPREQMPPVSPLPADSNGLVTLFSPNKVAKVTDEMLEIWRQILLRLPDARLIILSGGDRGGEARTRAAFADIDDSRLELIGRTSTQNYFQLFRRCDLVLDTFPYNGHTTSCDSLWMGLPVITLAGQTHVSRAGVSLLSKLELAQFIAHNPDEYVDRAVSAAQDRDALRQLRAGLRDRIRDKGLTDGTRLAREIEAAYRHMWLRWCQDGK